MRFVGTLAWSGHAAGTMGFGGFCILVGTCSISSQQQLGSAAWYRYSCSSAPRIRGQQPPLVDCFQVLRRFSTLAAWSVAVLAASGVLNTWFMTNGLRSFLGTEYGDLVLVKIACFRDVGLWRSQPLLAHAAIAPRQRPHGRGCNRALRLLCTSVSIEIALGLVVICVVAVLGQLPPPGHEHHMD